MYLFQKSISIFKLFLLFTLISNAAIVHAQIREISMDDLYKNQTFATQSVPGFNAMNDGIYYTQIDRDGAHKIQINQYELASGKKVKTLFDNTKNLAENEVLEVDDYIFSNDETKLLLLTESEPIYRRSILHNVYVFDRKANTVEKVAAEKVLHASFSPDGQQVAFVSHNNLYIQTLATKQTFPVTTDGRQNEIINGNCDWVYEEEFEFTQAYQWSPDGKTIAYYKFDESKVKEFTIPFYDETYPTLYTYKYPKAGEDNSIVGIYLYDISKNKTIATDLGAETDQYIPRIKWANKDELCVYRMNRLQNHLDLILFKNNAAAGRIIYSENNKYYIKIDDNLHFLPNENAFIFTSEKSGWNHLYKWNWDKQDLKPLTKGEWSVDQLIGIDLKSGQAYFTAGVNTPIERKLYKLNLETASSICLTPESGWHSITPCSGYKYFLDKHSNTEQVPVYTLIDQNGKNIRTLEDNKSLINQLNKFDLGKLTLTQYPGINGVMLNAYRIVPPNFDSTKKYPVLMHQYSGPGSQSVMDVFPLGNYFWHQMLAQKGYVIICVDGTGTGARGEAFEKKTYLQLGKYESDDQIAVAQYLAKQKWVDGARIGIWGWSYGGFMSSTCILKGNDVFKAAIAVAPVTNWRYYDNIYTERYMRTPQENPNGYDENAPETMAEKLKGNLLIIHGTADDNVHFQNAVALTKNLISANKQFESEYYPDKNHGIYGGNTRRQLYQRMTDYILKNL